MIIGNKEGATGFAVLSAAGLGVAPVATICARKNHITKHLTFDTFSKSSFVKSILDTNPNAQQVITDIWNNGGAEKTSFTKAIKKAATKKGFRIGSLVIIAGILAGVAIKNFYENKNKKHK